MRQRLIKKRIKVNRLKKDEQVEKRVKDIRKQMGQYLVLFFKNLKAKNLAAEEQ